MRRRLRASGSRPATRAEHTTLSEYPAGRGGLPGPDTQEYQKYAAIAVCAGLSGPRVTSFIRDQVSCRGEALVSCPRLQATLPGGSPEPAKSPFRAQDGEGCTAWWRDGSGDCGNVRPCFDRYGGSCPVRPNLFHDVDYIQFLGKLISHTTLKRLGKPSLDVNS